jgi:hypothetical protein
MKRLEQRRDRVEVGRRGKNVSVGCFDLSEEVAHAVVQHAGSRCDAGKLRALAAVSAEFDRIVAQLHDFDFGAVPPSFARSDFNGLVRDAAFPLPTGNGQNLRHTYRTHRSCRRRSWLRPESVLGATTRPWARR